MGTGNRGFTLIELLVVITLIASLMGLGLLMLGQAGEKRDVVKTTNRLTALQSALSSLAKPRSSGGYGMDVVTDPTQLRDPGRRKVGSAIGMPNATNLGIETLYVAVYLKGVDVADSALDEAKANTDEDNLSKQCTTRSTMELQEFVDAWGNPFAYFYGPDLVEGRWEKFSKYVMGNGTTVTVKPYKERDSDMFLNRDSYQLFSAGPDMTFNTEDDIKSW